MMVQREKQKHLKHLEKYSGWGALLTIVAAALLNVSFPLNKGGREIYDDQDLGGLDNLEGMIARKLLELGLTVEYEHKMILLEEGIVAERKPSGIKLATVPDFYFEIFNTDCFIEVGVVTGPHKVEQASLVKKAVSYEEGRKILYLQLVGKLEVRKFIKSVNSDRELFDYMLNHPRVINYTAVSA